MMMRKRIKEILVVLSAVAMLECIIHYKYVTITPKFKGQSTEINRTIVEHIIARAQPTSKHKELLHSKEQQSNSKNSSFPEHEKSHTLANSKTQALSSSTNGLSSAKSPIAQQKTPESTNKTHEFKEQIISAKDNITAEHKTPQIASKTQKLSTKEQVNDVRNSSTATQNHQQNLTTKIPSEGFHVIVSFRLMNISDKKENERMNEYVDCVKSFLNSSLVKQVHVVHDSPEMPGYIQEKTGTHPKLMLHQVKSPDMVLTLHQFAFTNLQGEMVIITQADIMIGEGFEKLNRTFLVKNRLFYSLSRHERECFTKPDYCKKYVGSHDTFVFVPNGTIPEEGKKILSHLIYSYGTENTVMHVYAVLLKYKVLNPCWILKVYHHHCSLFRKYTKKQIRIKTNHYRSYPVQHLI